MYCCKWPERPIVVSVVLATVSTTPIVTLTVVLAVALPSVALRVTVYTPAAAGVAAVAKVTVPAVPVPGCEKLSVRPVGILVVETVMAPVLP